jgi:hypothetical protein
VGLFSGLYLVILVELHYFGQLEAFVLCHYSDCAQNCKKVVQKIGSITDQLDRARFNYFVRYKT